MEPGRTIMGWSDPILKETWAKNRQQFEFFLENKQKPQPFTYADYMKLAQIIKETPIIGEIQRLFHTKTIGLRHIT